MLEFKLGASVNREVNCQQHSLLIVRVDILLQPFTAGLICIGNKLTPFELAHLLPVRAHAIDHVGTGSNKGPIKRFTFAQLTSDPSSLDAFPATRSYESNEFKLVGGPIAWRTCVDGHRSNKLFQLV